MEEELVQVLNNNDLDEKGKAEAIQKMVEAQYVPATVVANERKANKEALASKEKAFADLTAEYDTYKQSKMTEEEKKQEESRKKDEQYNNALKRLSKTTAMNVFANAGLKQEDYQDFIEDIVGLDEEKTKSLAEKICATIVKQKGEAANKIKKDIINGTTPPPAGEGTYNAPSSADQYKKLYLEAQKTGNINDMIYYQRLWEEEIEKNK